MPLQTPLPQPIAPLAVLGYTATTALGRGCAAQLQALRERRTGLRRNDLQPLAPGADPLDCWIGRVAGLEPGPLPAARAEAESRNNRLAWLALQQDGFAGVLDAAIARHGAERVAIVIGTSTSSIGASEEAYARLVDGAFPPDLALPLVHTPHSLGDFVQRATGLRGPCLTVATACSSSAKVFAQASRLIAAGVADAVLVGGVDTLCGSVLFGFNALQLVSTRPCTPFDADRVGLSLGEAGGFALLARASNAPGELQLRGYGESSDAHHMSAPHPQGLGAQLVMRDALARAGVDAGQVMVGPLNLQGPATPANDAAGALGVAALFEACDLHAGSTKGWTGHTLGAAGIVETVFTLLALEHGELPGTLNSRTRDPACGPQIRFDNAQRDDLRYAMNNSFGFGGNNCSLLFGRAA